MKRKSLRMMRALLLVGIVLALVLPTDVVLAQTTIYVDDDAPNDPGPGDPSVSDPLEDGSADHPFDEIQEGIDAAVSGDTVQVAAGTYYENISLKSGVVVQGAGAGVTTIDGGGSGSVVLANNVDSAAKLDGFTITNGSTSLGGGMYNEDASPAVVSCNFSGNSATYGGGMYNINSLPAVTNCTFSGNSASDRGGGICNYSASPVLTNCTFSSNSAYVGGGMYNNDSPATMINCIFSSNSASYDGGGIYNYDSSAIVTNCTFSGNSARYGGGICSEWDDSSLPIISNSIIVSNVATEGGGIYAYESLPIIDYNDVWSNSPDDYYGCSAGLNDISQDPLFVNPGAGDYHLQSGSTCIGAGDNSAPSLPSTDFEGDPRIWPEGGWVDMGADEFVLANQPPVADAGPDEAVEANTVGGANVTLDGSGSYDPDSDPLTYSWTWDGGSASGVSPTVLLPLGTTTVTLVVNDGTVDSDPDTVDITVQDTTPPEVMADLIPIKIKKEDKGTCAVEYSATDICDANPTVTVVIELPFVEGIDYEYKYNNGVIKVKGPSITLSVTAVDASGNVRTATVTLEFTG